MKNQQGVCADGMIRRIILYFMLALIGSAALMCIHYSRSNWAYNTFVDSYYSQLPINYNYDGIDPDAHKFLESQLNNCLPLPGIIDNPFLQIGAYYATDFMTSTKGGTGTPVYLQVQDNISGIAYLYYEGRPDAIFAISSEDYRLVLDRGRRSSGLFSVDLPNPGDESFAGVNSGNYIVVEDKYYRYLFKAARLTVLSEGSITYSNGNESNYEYEYNYCVIDLDNLAYISKSICIIAMYDFDDMQIYFARDNMNVKR